jgi:acyl-coenzyme A thioesterase PaaI-like protein
MERRTHEKMDPALTGAPVSLGEGRAVVELTCLPSMAADDTGLVHGGFTFGAADHAAMLAVNEPTVVLGAADTRFVAPTVVGDVVRAAATVVERKGNKRLVDVVCTVGEQEVFSGRFTCFVPEQHVLSAKREAD